VLSHGQPIMTLELTEHAVEMETKLREHPGVRQAVAGLACGPAQMARRPLVGYLRSDASATI